MMPQSACEMNMVSRLNYILCPCADSRKASSLVEDGTEQVSCRYMESLAGTPSPTCSTSPNLPLKWQNDLNTLMCTNSNTALTRNGDPTSGRSHLCHCPPFPPLRPHPLTGLPVDQRWGCWRHQQAPGQGRCCAVSPQSLPWPVGLRCWRPPSLSWSCSCFLSRCRGPCFLGPGLLDCCRWSLAGQWLQCLKQTHAHITTGYGERDCCTENIRRCRRPVSWTDSFCPLGGVFVKPQYVTFQFMAVALIKCDL